MGWIEGYPNLGGVSDPMSIVLASTWHPRGELPRLEKIMPVLGGVYSAIAIALPPFVEAQVVRSLRAIAERPGSILLPPLVTSDWRGGRYRALQHSLQAACSHVQYADLDRLLRWVETRPEEWRQAARHVEAADCLVIGRTPQAYATHPRALVETEEISNAVASHCMGRVLDFSAGSKGFSRRAAELLVELASPDQAMGSDSEWPILLQRADYTVDYIEVDGLDWEIPDHEQDAAADEERQRLLAESYDSDPSNWRRRVKVAAEIVQSALEASRRDIKAR
jgi:hypothetical protein